MSVERADPDASEWSALAAHHLPRYLLAASMSAGKNVLDAGCGAGYGAALLQAPSIGKAGAVLGVDLDADAVLQAQGRFTGVRFLVDDCQRLAQVEGLFDVICCFEVLEHLAEPEKFLAAAGARLAAGGLLLLSTPDRAASPPFKDGRPANAFHVTEWHGPELAALLGWHFSSVEMRTQVESHACAARREALDALRQGMLWSNPLPALLWRKFGRTGQQRSWKALEALMAPTLADYPIVDAALASIWGKPSWHVAICREPSGQELGPAVGHHVDR